MSTTEQTIQERLNAATAAEVYADLAKTVLSMRELEAPAMHEHAAKVRAEGDAATADKLDVIATRMEKDPLGRLLGRTRIGMLSAPPPDWPFTPREFKPSGRPEDMLARGIEQLLVAMGLEPTLPPAVVELLARLDAEQYPDAEES